MKRIGSRISIVLLGLFFGVCGTAQEHVEKPRKWIGFGGGANYSWLRTESGFTSMFNPEYGYGAGISVVQELNGNGALHVRLGYQRNTVSITLPLVDQTMVLDETVKLFNDISVLTVPVMYRFQFPSSRSYYIEGGLFAGVILSERTRANNESLQSSVSLSQLDILDGLDAGVVFGLGRYIRLTDKMKLQLSTGAELGIIDVVSDGIAPTIRAATRTSSVHVRAVLLFSFNGQKAVQ